MKRFSKTLYTAVFFVLLYCFFYFQYNTSLFCYFHQPMFLFSGTFLKDFLQFPGGLLDWAGQFIFQFFELNWAGAMILTAISGSVFLLTDRLLRQEGFGPISVPASLIPFGFLLFILNQYPSPLVISIRFLAVLLMCTAYSRFRKMKPVLILLLWPLYVLVGGWSFLFYCVMIIIYELGQSGNKMRFLYMGIHFLSGALIPFIAARIVYPITPAEAFKYLYPVEFHLEPFRFHPGMSVRALFLSLPVIMIIGVAYRRIFREKTPEKPTKTAWIFFGPVQLILMSAVSGCILYLSHDSGLKTRIAIDRYAEQDEWQNVLNLAGRSGIYDRMVNFQVNRAFYHQGRLLDDLFSFPQRLGSDGLLVHRIIASQIAVSSSDLLYDLAHIKGSQTMAYEGQTRMETNPRILKRLVMTHVIDREYPAAQKFVDVLKQSLMHRKEARELETLLSDRTSNADPVIAGKRALQPDEDFFFDNQNFHRDLEKLVSRHPGNRMAFEYLIACDLLDARITDVYKRIHEFPKYRYQTPPRHVEEAMVLLKALDPDRVDLKGIPIHRETLKRFQTFNKTLSQIKDPITAEKVLRSNFGGTYWFYARYTNPKVKKIKMEARTLDETGE